MKILAIDPGTTESAYVIYETSTRQVLSAYKIPNGDMVEKLMRLRFLGPYDAIVIEMIKSYGMAVGDTVFETCVWIGRFIQASPLEPVLIGRKTVATELCGNPRAKDANVRQELVNRFGPGKDKALGTKTNPGPLYGVKSDMFSALAIAIVYDELQKRKVPEHGLSFLS